MLNSLQQVRLAVDGTQADSEWRRAVLQKLGEFLGRRPVRSGIQKPIAGDVGVFIPISWLGNYVTTEAIEHRRRRARADGVDRTWRQLKTSSPLSENISEQKLKGSPRRKIGAAVDKLPK